MAAVPAQAPQSQPTSPTPPGPASPASAPPAPAPPARVQPTDAEWDEAISSPTRNLPPLDPETVALLQQVYDKFQKLNVLLDKPAEFNRDDGSEHLEWLEEDLKAAVMKSAYAAETPPTNWDPNPSENFWNTAALEKLRKTERVGEKLYKDLNNVASKALALAEVAAKHHEKNGKRREDIRSFLERVKAYGPRGLAILNSLAEDLTVVHVNEKAKMQQAIAEQGAEYLAKERQNLESIKLIHKAELMAAQAENKGQGIGEGNVATTAVATLPTADAPESQNETPSPGRLPIFAHSDKHTGGSGWNGWELAGPAIAVVGLGALTWFVKHLLNRKSRSENALEKGDRHPREWEARPLDRTRKVAAAW
jgi:hypothetical protein